MFQNARVKFLVVALTAGLWTNLSLAAIDGSIEENVEASSSTASGLGITIESSIYGIGITRWNNRKPKADGGENDPLAFMNQIFVTYPTSMGWDFTVVPQFDYHPVLTSDTWRPFQLNDLGVGVSRTLSSGGWSLWTRLENYLPISEASQTDGLLLNPSIFATLSYRFPFGLEIQATVNPTISLFDNGNIESFLFFSPRVNYYFSDEFSLFGYMETASHTIHNDDGLLFTTSQQDTHVGLGFHYGGDFWIEPSINVLAFPDTDESAVPFVAVFLGGRFL